jgi:GMP synthase-like glutamine amidotransferase
MSVLICKNIEIEGPGTIEDYLRMQQIPYKIVELSKGEVIPNPDNFDILIIMGGPMSVNEAEIYPYIEEEEKLIRDFISKGRKILGICLGAQIMAKALGSRVYPGLEKEIGWYDIEFTEEGMRDPLMQKLAIHPESGDLWRKFKVFHWHGETFDIPQGAVRLAGSELYPNQAFRYGSNAYAFQFHIEVTKEMIHEWCKDEPVDFPRMEKDTEKFYNVYHQRAMNFYKVFLKSGK